MMGKLLLVVGLIFSLVSCKSMNERNVSSLNPQADMNEAPTTKDSPLGKYYQNIVKKLEVKVADKNGRRWERCDDDDTSCMKATCDAGGFYCKSQSELEKVIRLCRNIDGNCVSNVCAEGGFYCKSQSELEKVLSLCKESRGTCVKKTCSEGGFYCKSQSELEKVISLCKGVDGRCVSDTCAQGGFYCKSQSELEKVMGLCRR